jgi:hypothetical protein
MKARIVPILVALVMLSWLPWRAGFGTPLMHQMTMGQEAAACLSHCLSASHPPDIAPAPLVAALVAGLAMMATTVVALAGVLFGAGIAGAARARSSPDLTLLYGHRLD